MQSQDPSDAPNRGQLSTVLYGTAALVTVIVLIVVITKALGGKVLDTPLPAAASGGKPAEGPKAERPQPPRDDRSLALVELRQVDSLASSAVAAVEGFERACASWEQDVAPLLSNEPGKRLASSPESTRAAMAVLDLKREPLASARNFRLTIDTLVRPVRDALETKTDYRPAAGTAAKLEEVRAQAESATNAIRAARGELLALVASHAASTPSVSTLDQAIEALRAGDALARAKAVGEEQAKAEVEARDAVAAAEKQRVDAAKDAELRRIATETSLAEKQAEFKRLRSLASDPSVQAQFQPFLQKGTRVPWRDGKGVTWRSAGGRAATPADAIPYELLAQCRVFETVEDMVAVGTSSGRQKNDRTTWVRPADTDEKAWDDFRKRFALLKEVAPIWHDMGLLGPPPAVPHLPDPDKLAPQVTAQFDGEWSCPEYGGVIRIEGTAGKLVKPNSPAFQVGQQTFVIDEVTGKTIRGRVLFTAGNWIPVTAELVSENKLRFTGDGKQWHLEKNR